MECRAADRCLRCITGGQQGSADHRLEAVAVSYTYVKEQIEEQLGEEYLEMSPLDGGSDGTVLGEQY